jgi:hypothetical protein
MKIISEDSYIHLLPIVVEWFDQAQVRSETVKQTLRTVVDGVL